MAEEQTSGGGKDLKKYLIFGFIGLNVLVLCLGAFLVYSATLGYTPKVASNEQLSRELDEFVASLRANPVMFKMSPINTNLSGVPRRMIRMEVNLEMLNEEGFEEVVDMSAETKDSILRIINAKDYDELETLQGKLLLKNQIIAQLNGFLKRGVVKNVYFSDFVVQ